MTWLANGKRLISLVQKSEHGNAYAPYAELAKCVYALYVNDAQYALCKL